MTPDEIYGLALGALLTGGCGGFLLGWLRQDWAYARGFSKGYRIGLNDMHHKATFGEFPSLPSGDTLL